MIDYGTDVSTFPVTDMTGRTISGRRAVLECLLRRYTTPNGSLEYDPLFGFDLKFLLAGDFSDDELLSIKAAIVREALKDERIDDAFVDLTLDTSASRLLLRIGGILSDGAPFSGVLSIDNVTAEVLAVT